MADATPVADDVLAAIRYCFDEAMLDTQEAIKQRALDWKDIQGLQMSMDAFMDRMEAMGTRKPERVPFDRILKECMKREFPEFSYRRGQYKDPDSLSFGKSISPSMDLILMVNKIRGWGLGKSFSLGVGIEIPQAKIIPHFRGADVSSIFGFLSNLAWAYHSKVDLELALGGLTQMLREILPTLEQSLGRWLGEVPTAIPPNQPTNIGLSAREAMIIAERFARAWRHDAFTRSLSGRNIDPEGRLSANGVWSFTFGSVQSSDTSTGEMCFRAHIRGTGRTRHGLLNGHFRPGQMAPLLHWADSPQAWDAVQKIADEQMGKGSLSSGRIDEIAVPDTGQPAHQWCLDYEQPGKTYAAHIVLSAADLAVIRMEPAH